jgi:hypothetical protein
VFPASSSSSVPAQHCQFRKKRTPLHVYRMSTANELHHVSVYVGAGSHYDANGHVQHEPQPVMCPAESAADAESVALAVEHHRRPHVYPPYAFTPTWFVNPYLKTEMADAVAEEHAGPKAAAGDDAP